MAVKQYPHFIFIIEAGDGTQDADGNWVAGQEPSLISVSKCRDERNGAGRQIEVGGGSYQVFKSLIQLPKGVKRIKEGTHIIVTDDMDGEQVRLKGRVLMFDEAQLHSRLWV